MSSLFKTRFGIEIPVYDGYQHVLVFPSPQTTKMVHCIDYERTRFISYIQNKQNVNLLTKEKKNLTFTGHFFLPYFEGHDYVILPGSEKSILYYNYVPHCLQEYPFLVTFDGLKVQ